MKRVIFDAVLFISVFIFPWWISVFLMLAGIFIFNNFYEFIVASIVIYSLHAVPGAMLISSPAFFSLIIIISYIIFQTIKDNIILYKK